MWSNDSFKLSHSPKVNVTPLFVGYQRSSPEALKKCRKWTNTCPSYFFTTKLRAFSPLRLPRVHMLLLLLLSSPLMSTDWRLPRLPLFYSLLLDQSEQSDADVVCTSLCATSNLCRPIFSSSFTSWLRRPRLDKGRSWSDPWEKMPIHPDIEMVWIWDRCSTRRVYLARLFVGEPKVDPQRAYEHPHSPFQSFRVRDGGPPLLNVPHGRYPKPVFSSVTTAHFHPANATETPVLSALFWTWSNRDRPCPHPTNAPLASRSDDAWWNNPCSLENFSTTGRVCHYPTRWDLFAKSPQKRKDAPCEHRGISTCHWNCYAKRVQRAVLRRRIRPSRAKYLHTTPVRNRSSSPWAMSTSRRLLGENRPDHCYRIWLPNSPSRDPSSNHQSTCQRFPRLPHGCVLSS